MHWFMDDYGLTVLGMITFIVVGTAVITVATLVI